MSVHRCKICKSEAARRNDNTLNFLIQVESQKESMVCYDCYKKIHRAVESLPSKKHLFKSDRDNLFLMMNPDNIPEQDEKATPSKIKAYLDQYIIGQDRAKRQLATAIYNQQMIALRKSSGQEMYAELEKTNVIMIGPSGSGKTAMLKRLSKMLNVPFVIEDITGYSSTGYVGQDIDLMLRHLIDAADGDIKLAERGIIYIDEIDKCARKGTSANTTADPSHQDLQACLLKLIEGSEVEVCEKGLRHHPLGSTIKMKTDNILFIVGGAFDGLEKIIEKRQNRGNKNSIGFSVGPASEEKSKPNGLLGVTPEDLKKYGIMPELLGRLPLICTLEQIDEAAIRKILIEPKNSVFKQYRTLFRLYNAKLSLSESAINQIVKMAIQRKTGARSLRGIMEEILSPLMFKLPDNMEVTKEYMLCFRKNFYFKIKDISEVLAS